MCSQRHLGTVQQIVPVLEPFCPSPKSEIALINTIQLHCYTEAQLLKAFVGFLKVSRFPPSMPSFSSPSRACTHVLTQHNAPQVLYNGDVISDSAIIFWHQKGAKPQGKETFLAAAAPLVKVSWRVPPFLSALASSRRPLSAAWLRTDALSDAQFLEEDDDDE